MRYILLGLFLGGSLAGLSACGDETMIQPDAFEVSDSLNGIYKEKVAQCNESNSEIEASDDEGEVLTIIGNRIIAEETEDDCRVTTEMNINEADEDSLLVEILSLSASSSCDEATKAFINLINSQISSQPAQTMLYELEEDILRLTNEQGTCFVYSKE